MGLRLLFARALRPGTPSGFVWPQPPAEHQQHQHAAGQKTRPKAPQWDTTPKFTPMALKHDVPVPSLPFALNRGSVTLGIGRQAGSTLGELL